MLIFFRILSTLKVSGTNSIKPQSNPVAKISYGLNLSFKDFRLKI